MVNWLRVLGITVTTNVSFQKKKIHYVYYFFTHTVTVHNYQLKVRVKNNKTKPIFDTGIKNRTE